MHLIRDYICLDGWQYYHNHTDAGLISPELDMSKDGGKFTVKVKLAGAATTALDKDGKEITVNTQAAFALFNYDEAIGDYKQAELIYPEGYPKAVTNDWKEFTINFTRVRRSLSSVSTPFMLTSTSMLMTSRSRKTIKPARA